MEDNLARIIGIKRGSKLQVYNALWNYIKLNRLLDKENTNVVNNDAELTKVFKRDVMEVTNLPALLNNLFTMQRSVETELIIE